MIYALNLELRKFFYRNIFAHIRKKQYLCSEFEIKILNTVICRRKTARTSAKRCAT